MVLAGISYTTSVIHIEPDEITQGGMILLFPRVIYLRIAISPMPICAAKSGCPGPYGCTGKLRSCVVVGDKSPISLIDTK
jgi:hypothetical protein